LYGRWPAYVIVEGLSALYGEGETRAVLQDRDIREWVAINDYIQLLAAVFGLE